LAPARASWPGCRCATGACYGPCTPRYAGAFVYGRRRERKRTGGKTFHQSLPRDQWTALIPGAHVGYITWEQFEANQVLLAANAAAYGAERNAGPAREGPALLQGLAICGRCGGG
jgi:hypothetical protein